MGSSYQFPQSLSLTDFNNIRDPSFSSYLNDADVRVEVKLAELTRLTSCSEWVSDEEIGVFRADKYFNEGLESEQKPKESEFRRSAVELSKGELVSSPVRSKISLGTTSIRSESSSRHSQTALLQSFPNKAELGRRSTGEVPRKKGFLSRIIFRCSCVGNKSKNIEDQHNGEHREANMNRADQLLQVSANQPEKPNIKDTKMLFHPSITPLKFPSPKLRKSVKGGSDSFNFPATEIIKKSTSIERKLGLLNWDKLNSKSEDVNLASTISVEYYTDAESDASSDLFEIDSFTGQKKLSFSSHIPDSSASGYAPSEASIDWSVVTASAVDFSNISDCEDFKYPNLVPNTQINRHAVIEKHKQNSINSCFHLKDCTDQKAGRVLENMDLHKTRDIVSFNQRMVPLSGIKIPR